MFTGTSKSKIDRRSCEDLIQFVVHAGRKGEFGTSRRYTSFIVYLTQCTRFVSDVQLIIFSS